MLYVHYWLRFWKDPADVKALIELDSEFNAMTPAYTLKLGLWARHTDVEAQKIDGSTLQTFGMVLANLLVEDKFGRARFLEETFLLADISVEVVLNRPFWILSNADVKFAVKKLT